DSLIEQSSGQEKAIWQSIAAQNLWFYYEENRITILDRTTLLQDPDTDLTTWDAATFFHTIAKLYLLSISAQQLLQHTPLEDFSVLLHKGENTRHLRPTLYDLLAFRAVNYFENDEQELSRPANQFEIREDNWFAPAAEFVQIQDSVPDQGSPLFRALGIYQDILDFHLADRSEEALLDADLQRLEFVYTYATQSNKKELYLQALRQIEKRYPKSAAGARAAVKRIAIQINDSDHPGQRPALHAELKEIAAQHSGTEAGMEALQLIQTLEAKGLNLVTEKVYLPNEYLKVLLHYKNVPTVYLQVYRCSSNLSILESLSSKSSRFKALNP